MSTQPGNVGIVVVSHSALISEGIVALSAQMAPNVEIVAAGGTDDSGIGTSFTKVREGIGSADDGAGVLVLCDIGSAIMTAEAAIEFSEADGISAVRIAKAPIVEGAIAAAVACENGASLDEAASAAEAACSRPEEASGSETRSGTVTDGRYVRRVILTNEDGLHARPAAEFVRLASTFSERVFVNGKDAKSLLAIMSLGLLKGATAEITAESLRAENADAVDALADLIESNFTSARSAK